MRTAAGRLIIYDPRIDQAGLWGREVVDPPTGPTLTRVHTADGRALLCRYVGELEDDRRHRAAGSGYGDVVACPSCRPAVEARCTCGCGHCCR